VGSGPTGITEFNYPALFLSSASELIGCTIGMALVDRAGRKRVAGLAYILCAVFLGLLVRCSFMNTIMQLPRAIGIHACAPLDALPCV
jgi:hypothetical protein